MSKLSEAIASLAKADRPETLMKMSAIWWGEHCAEQFYLAQPDATDQVVLRDIEEQEHEYLELHPAARPAHLREAGAWFREGYRKQSTNLRETI